MASETTTDPEIRLYKAADRASVFRIAADTATFGAPVEAFLDDRRLFLDAVYRVYLDAEPEHAWVADVSGEVAGFLAGCTDTRRRDRYIARKVVPTVAANLLRGRYRLGSLTLRYAGAVIVAALRREFPSVDLMAYPAHLHVNVDGRWRGLGAGRQLMEAFLAQLRSLAVPGVHLRATSLNAAAVALYDRLGFELLDVRQTRLWAHVVEGSVENRVYGLKLG